MSVSDADQPQFAKQHPVEASKRVRGSSLDGYLKTGTSSNGQRIQTRYTFEFFVGEPSYPTVREEFIPMASGKALPLSRGTNLVVP
jgi:hypothetical protein